MTDTTQSAFTDEQRETIDAMKSSRRVVLSLIGAIGSQVRSKHLSSEQFIDVLTTGFALYRLECLSEFCTDILLSDDSPAMREGELSISHIAVLAMKCVEVAELKSRQFANLMEMTVESAKSKEGQS